MRYAHSSPPSRMIVYGIGKYGQYIVRFAVQKGWQIIAAYKFGGEEIGRDGRYLLGTDAQLGEGGQDYVTESHNGSATATAMLPTTATERARAVEGEGEST